MTLNKVFGALSCFFILGCGVKGDPVPPGTPVEISRGRPKLEGSSVEKRRPLLATPKSKKPNDDDEEADE